MRDMAQMIEQLLLQLWVDLLQQKQTGFATLPDVQYPGVYLLAYTDEALEGRPIKLKDIFYVGMTNSLGGVKERLTGFVNGIERHIHHSGGMRFYKEYANNTPFSVFSTLNNGKHFFVASISFTCEVRKVKRTAEDLETMGDVAQLEYYVLAHLKRTLGHEPALNKK